MKQTTRPRRLRSFIVCAIATFAASCAPPTAAPDYRDRFPLKVEIKKSTLKIDFIGPGARAPDADADRFGMFVGEFLRRARSPMTVTTRAGMRDRVRALLVGRGVMPGNVVFRAAPAKMRGAVLEFRGYVVAVPDCGDWSGWAGFDPANAPHTNFGCAFQRNVGLMLSDPGDLVRPRPTVSSDARRDARVLGIYRDGTAAGSQPPRSEEGVISDIK